MQYNDISQLILHTKCKAKCVGHLLTMQFEVVSLWTPIPPFHLRKSMPLIDKRTSKYHKGWRYRALQWPLLKLPSTFCPMWLVLPRVNSVMVRHQGDLISCGRAGPQILTTWHDATCQGTHLDRMVSCWWATWICPTISFCFCWSF